MAELMFKGCPTGYHKCKSCYEKGDLHIIKCFDKDSSKFQIQYAKKHFKSKAHIECGIGKIFGFSKNWKQEMDKKYLKLMATQRVSGRIFQSETFVDIIVSWVNQVTNAKIDTQTVLDQMPSPKKLYDRMHVMSKEQRGKFEILLQFIAIIFFLKIIAINCKNIFFRKIAIYCNYNLIKIIAINCNKILQYLEN